MLHFLFGNLTLQSLSFLYVPILTGTFVVVAIGGVLVLAVITYSAKWGLGWRGLWKDWICSVDHKKVGIMYMILGIVALFRGFSDAILMRSQQAIAVGSNHGYLPPEHYNQIFTAHGVIMIFFFAMSFVFFLANYFVVLQIGARDVAFPFLNSLSFWCAVGGFIIIMMSLFVGNFARTGWLAYPPLSEMQYSPDVGVDYYLWALTISGFGTLLGGINILVTIVKMRCPGMTLMRMPLFTWSVFCSVILIVIAFPVLNITLGMLFFDRFFGTHLFTSGMGGNAMLYINLIWVWGHPEVYILVLPAFGIFSEVVATFSRKSLFGYSAMVWATVAITFLSFTVWLHHFFTMGSGADVNSFFGIATAMISIPTGVKIFNWLATMYRGRIQFTTPMMWTLAFLITFTVGGMTGVLMAVPGVDFQIHNSVFLVAHFHNTIIGGVVFGMFAGLTYWWPKIFGFKLCERWGKAAFWCWVPGFYLAFMPLYALGFMGMTRRLDHYSVASGFHPFLVVAAMGALLISIGILCQIIQVGYSIKNRHKLRVGNDPWDARTLEWSIPSPTPFYNFALTPTVEHIDDFWRKKQKGLTVEKPHYTEIHMPKSTCTGFLIAAFGTAFCFAMIWHIWWMAAVGGAGMLITIIARSFNFDIDYYVPAAEVEKTEAQALAGAKL